MQRRRAAGPPHRRPLGGPAGARAKEIAESGLECSHIVYNDLIARPLETVKAIYKQFGWSFTAEYEALLVQFLEEDKVKRAAMKSNKGGAKETALHHYTPEEFSLTAKELSEGRFAEYVQAFKVPMSKD